MQSVKTLIFITKDLPSFVDNNTVSFSKASHDGLGRRQRVMIQTVCDECLFVVTVGVPNAGIGPPYTIQRVNGTNGACGAKPYPSLFLLLLLLILYFEHFDLMSQRLSMSVRLYVFYMHAAKKCVIMNHYFAVVSLHFAPLCDFYLSLYLAKAKPNNCMSSVRLM